MKYALIGLLLVAGIIGFVLWDNQGSRLVLNGKVVKTRVQAADENNTAVIMEVRVNNPADYPFEVKKVTVRMTDAKGNPVDGTLFREPDLKAFFDYFKASLGPRYNSLLRAGERIKAGDMTDRTVAASFPVPEVTVAGRRQISIHLEAVDGRLVSEILEKPAAK